MSQKRRTVADEPFLDVRSLPSDARRGQDTGHHRHDWHQLIYAASGVLAVSTEAGSWIVPSSWAVWVPAGMRHAISYATDSRLRTLYLRPGSSERLPDDCRTIGVSGLLRALILRTGELGMLDRRVSVEAALALLIAEELRSAEAPPFALRQPVTPALRKAATLMEDSPPSTQVAKAVGLSVRVLERRFKAETGMTPAHWRQHRALLFAVERLAAGDPVKMVAADCGYASPSAFVAAFRRRFGVTPGRYLDAGALQGPAQSGSDAA